MKNIILNATALGNNCSSPSIVTGTKYDCIIAPDIIGPIAPPIILKVFITAAEVAITAFGINKIIIASRVTISPEPTPKNNRLITTCSGVECSTVNSMNENRRAVTPGIISLVVPYFAARIPEIGPRITIANEKGNCRMPTPIASRPNPLQK
jgi:hypothetical protein